MTWNAITSSRSKAYEMWEYLVVRGLVLGLLFGIFALAIPHLVLAALGLCIAVFAFFCPLRPIHRIGIAVGFNYACWALGGLLSGGLGGESLLAPEFWRGEGRCFLFYLPLLAFSFVAARRSELRFVVKAICCLATLGVALCALWLLGLGHLFQTADGDAPSTSIYFIGLQTTHTGAGAFWGTVTAFLAAYSLKTRQSAIRLLAICAALLTLATGGRAATLGLIAVLAWFVLQGELINRRTVKYVIPVVFFLVVGVWSVFATLPHVGERMGEVFQARTFKSVVAATREPTLRSASGTFHSGANLEHHNLVIRVFLWKYALHLFRESPLLGIGYGRFNDTQLEFTGIPHFIHIAHAGERFLGSGVRWEEGQKMSSTGNAHNSYLHVLAESGAIGLLLLLWLWWLMYSDSGASAAEGEFEAAYAAGCRAAIICLLVAALAGHALAAPSGGIFVTTVVGARLAYSRTCREPRQNTR